MANWLDSVLDSLDKTDPESVIQDEVTDNEEVTASGKKDKKKDTAIPADAKGIFVVNEKGMKPDRTSRQLFDMMNQRAGSIFSLDRDTGEILTGNKGADTIGSNINQSRTLAEIIQDNIGSNAKQLIKLRVGTGMKGIELDGYFSGKVDLDDVKFNGLKNYQTVMQAVMMYHIIFERSSTPNYESKVGDSAIMETYEGAHNAARKNEKFIWDEMTGESITILPVAEVWGARDPNNPSEADPNYEYNALNYGDTYILFKRNKRTRRITYEEHKYE